MKKIYSIVIFLLVSNILIGQAPASFKYQAVLRDARGNARTNTAAGIGIDLLQGGAIGFTVYRETHNVTTDGFGLINIEIGKGTPSIGSLSGVDWSAGPYFIKVIVDGLEMGTSQLLSVPYALYAKTAGNGFSGRYNDLTAKPALFDGSWSSLNGRPAFAPVATSGSYNDLTNKPVIFSGDYASLTGKPTLSLVASTGSYSSLLNKPVLFDGTWANLTGKPVLFDGSWLSLTGKPALFDGTWLSLTGKPDLSIVATSGSYDDLTNKPNLSIVAVSGNYTDLNGKPTGSNVGDVQYWNGTDWVMVPVGQPGQFLQLTNANTPAWSGNAFPKLTTEEISLITQTEAVSGGTITNDGGASVSTRGICWSTVANPTIADNKTSDGAGIGLFSSSLTGLISGIKYYVRAYSTNSVGTSYGNELNFTTLSFPTVTTSPIISITHNTAVSGGNVSDAGGTAVITRGVCWSTSTNPTISDNSTSDGSGEGTFISSVTGLIEGTIYYLRSYATNSEGTGYGDEISFITTKMPTLTTASISSISQNSATSGGNVTSDGGSLVTARGVCWSTNTNPTIADNKTSAGTGSGPFTSTISGLTAGTTYYVRAFSTNSVGTSYGIEVNFTTSTNSISYLNGNEAYWTESSNGFRAVKIGNGDLLFEYDAVNKQYVSGNLILIPNKVSTPNGEVVDKNSFYGFSSGNKDNSKYQWDGQKNSVLTVTESEFDKIRMFVSPLSATSMTYAQALNVSSANACTNISNSNVTIDGNQATLLYPGLIPAAGTYNLWNGAELVSAGVLKNSASTFGASKNEYSSQQQLAISVNQSYCVSTYGQGWRLPTDIEIGHTTNIYSPALPTTIDKGYQGTSGQIFTSSRFYYPGYAFYKWYVVISEGSWNNIDQWSKTKFQVRCVYNGK